MRVIDRYWLQDKDAPYATFLSIVGAYLHPVTDDLNGLREDAWKDGEPFLTFKKEFREIFDEPTVLPEGALYTATLYRDMNDEAFCIDCGGSCTLRERRESTG